VNSFLPTFQASSVGSEQASNGLLDSIDFGVDVPGALPELKADCSRNPIDETTDAHRAAAAITAALSFAVAADSIFYRAHARFVAADKTDAGSQQLVYQPIIVRNAAVTNFTHTLLYEPRRASNE
jgi:hypothetical protein